MNTLKKAGGVVEWGLEEDVFEYAVGDKYPNVVSAGRYKEGLIKSSMRSLSEGVIGVEIEGATIGKAEFSALRALKNLVWVELRDCTIDEAILRRERLPAGIKWLILNGSSLEPMGKSFLSEANAIEWLELAGCDVTDSILEQVSRCQQLRVLDVSGNIGITDAGLEELSRLRQLHMLDLSDDIGITDAGLEKLGKAENVRVLRLNDTRVTHVGLQHLAQLQELEYLELLRTQITDESVRSLADRLPKLEFKTEHRTVDPSVLDHEGITGQND